MDLRSIFHRSAPAAQTPVQKLATDALAKLGRRSAPETADAYLGNIEKEAGDTAPGQVASFTKKVAVLLTDESARCVRKAAFNAVAAGLSGPSVVALAEFGVHTLPRMKDEGSRTTFGKSLLETIAADTQDAAQLSVVHLALENRQEYSASPATLMGRRLVEVGTRQSARHSSTVTTYQAALKVIAAGKNPGDFAILEAQTATAKVNAENKAFHMPIFDSRGVSRSLLDATSDLDLAEKMHVFACAARQVVDKVAAGVQDVETQVTKLSKLPAAPPKVVVEHEDSINIGTLRIPKNPQAVS